MRRLQFLAVAIVGSCAVAHAHPAHDVLTVAARIQESTLAQPGPMMMEMDVGEIGPRSGTMSFDRSNEVELVFENVRRLLAQRDYANALPLLQEALDTVINDKVLEGDTFRHPWFQALSLLRAFPPEAQVLIERFAGARAAASLERAWRDHDLRAIERIAVQFRYTEAGRDALRMLAASAIDEGDFRIASAWYARLFEEEPDPLFAAAQDPAGVVNWLICEAKLNSPEGITRIWRRYQGIVGSQLVVVHGDPVSVQSWLINAGLLPPALTEPAPAELTLLIPAGIPVWEHSTEDADELRRDSSPVLKLLGEYGMTGLHASPALIVGDRALVASIGGLSCLDVASGELLWRKEFDPPTSVDASAADGDLTVARRSLGGGLYDQFTCDGRTVYYLSEDPAIHSSNDQTMRRRNRLVACDLQTGEVRWELQDVRIAGDRRASIISQYFLSAPAVDGQRLYILGQESFQADGTVQLLILNAETGESLSSIELGVAPERLIIDLHRQEFGGRIVLQGELVICATGWGSVMGVDPSARVMRWAHTFPRLNRHAVQSVTFYYTGIPSTIGWEWWRGWRGVTLATAGDRTVFASPETDRLIVYDYRSGNVAWERPRGFGRFVAGVLADRVLVASSNSIEAFDLMTGAPLWTAATPPIVGNGFLAGGYYVAPVGDGGCVAIDVADGRLAFQSRQNPNALSPAAVGLTAVHEPASLVQQGDALLRITSAGIARLQPLSQLETLFDEGDQFTAEQRLQQATLHEELGHWDEADRILASLASGDPDIAERATQARSEMLLRKLLSGHTLSGEQDTYLRASPRGKDYVSLLVHQRLMAIPSDQGAAETTLSGADSRTLLDDILTLMADAPERVFFNAPQGRRVRLDRYLQGAILTLLEHVDESSRGEVEQHLESELLARFENAESPRTLWHWITRCDRLPWGQAYAVRPGSIAGLTGGERLSREMLLWELSLSKDSALAVQAIMRLAELPSSRVDGVPELLLQRITPHLQTAIDEGRTVAEIVDAGGEDTIWSLALASGETPFWPENEPEVSDYGRPMGNATGRTVQVAPSFPSPLARFNVEVTPATGVPSHIRFRGLHSFWSDELPSEIARLKLYVPSPYVTDPSELVRGWNVGPVVYLQVGAELMGYLPFDEQGEQKASTAWPRQMEIRTTGSADHQITETMLSRRAGVRGTDPVYSDSFGYRADLFGPFRTNFFCAPETGDLVVRSAATGREFWSMPVTSSSHWLANDEVVIVYDEQSWLFTVHRAVDGELLASHTLPTAPLDVLQSTGALLLLEMPVDNPGAGATTQLVAWQTQAGSSAWSRPLTPASMVFLVDEQLIGVIDRTTEELELIDIHTGAIACRHVPDQPDQVEDIQCIVDAGQVIVIVKRAGGEGEGQVVVRDPRSIRLNGTLHAFDRGSMSWAWSRHIKDVDVHLDQPNQVPLLVMHENTSYTEDPFAFSETPTYQTKLRFAVLDRRTGDMLVDETLEYARPAAFEWILDVDAEQRVVHLRTNAGRGFQFDYLPGE